MFQFSESYFELIPGFENVVRRRAPGISLFLICVVAFIINLALNYRLSDPSYIASSQELDYIKKCAKIADQKTFDFVKKKMKVSEEDLEKILKGGRKRFRRSDRIIHSSKEATIYLGKALDSKEQLAVKKYQSKRSKKFFEREVINLIKVQNVEGMQKLVSINAKKMIIVSKHHGVPMNKLKKVKVSVITGALLQVGLTLEKLAEMNICYNNLPEEHICVTANKKKNVVATIVNLSHAILIGEKPVKPKIIKRVGWRFKIEYGNPPEVMKKKKCTEHTDVYYLGFVIGKMLETKLKDFPYTKLALISKAAQLIKPKKRPILSNLVGVLKYAQIRALKKQKRTWFKNPFRKKDNPMGTPNKRHNKQLLKYLPVKAQIYGKQEIYESIEDAGFTKLGEGRYGINHFADFYGVRAVLKKFKKPLEDFEHEGKDLGKLSKAMKNGHVHGIQDLMGVCYNPPTLLSKYHGYTLRERMRRGQLEPGHLVLIAVRIIKIVDKLTIHGMTHNKITLDHFCISDDLDVRLISWGWAKKIGSDFFLRKTSDRQMFYLAPEIRLKKERVSHRSELYSVGYLVKQVLMGVPGEADLLRKWAEKATSKDKFDRGTYEEGLEIGKEVLTWFMDDETVKLMHPNDKTRGPGTRRIDM